MRYIRQDKYANIGYSSPSNWTYHYHECLPRIQRESADWRTPPSRKERRDWTKDTRACTSTDVEDLARVRSQDAWLKKSIKNYQTTTDSQNAQDIQNKQEKTSHKTAPCILWQEAKQKKYLVNGTKTMIFRIVSVMSIFLLGGACVDQVAAPIRYGHSAAASLVDDTPHSVSGSVDVDSGPIVQKSLDEDIGTDRTSGSLEYHDEATTTDPVTNTNHSRIIYYEVEDGETLESIAKSYGRSVQDIVNLNDLTYPYHIEHGQIIKVQIDSELLNSKNAKSDLSAVDNNFKFISPITGRMITSFGGDASFGKSMGIEIAAAAGSPVKSVSRGRIISVINKEPFGHSVIMKSDIEDFYIAYANLRDVLVTKGEMVIQGDIIGYVEHDAQINTGRLYFAIRKGKVSVDPLKYVPLN